MIELWLLAPQQRVDPLSDALLELDALSVSVEDADADTPDEVAQYGEPGLTPVVDGLRGWHRTVVRALFADSAAATQAATLLLAQSWACDVHVQGMQPVPDQDWVRLTQAQFDPVLITEHFCIVPSWHRPPAQATHVMRLDPGMAFGTGTHPTTRMCLRWIAAHAAQNWPRVLDYGCGSGILAIGAAMHGAQHVDAVDIDPAAVLATQNNAAANGVTVHAGDPQQVCGSYDLVLANILATPLKLLAPLLCNLVAPGGHLVLAGLLERQVPELKAVYAPWLALQAVDSEDGWVALSGRCSDAASPMVPTGTPMA